MKKNLVISAIALGIAALFAACNPGQSTSGALQGISINPESVELTTENPTIRLTVVANPTTAKIDTKKVVWKSSDDSIATVNELGVVTAVDYGKANITASYTEGNETFEAVCPVTVLSYIESLKFTQCCFLNFEVDSNDIRTIKSGSGQEYKCYRLNCHFRAFSEGFYYDETGHLSGSDVGSMITFDAPTYYGDSTLNGVDASGNPIAAFFVLGAWQVGPYNTKYEPTDYHYDIMTGAPGTIKTAEYAKTLVGWTQKINNGEQIEEADIDELDKYIDGAGLHIWYYSSADESYRLAQGLSIVPDALVDGAVFYMGTSTKGTSTYMNKLDYSYAKYTPIEGNVWGLDATYDANATPKFTVNSENILLGDPIETTYGQLPTQESVRIIPADQVVVMERDDPEVYQRIMENEKAMNIENALIRK
ncbi:MAG: Ig-like domain-containing protein [Paludibacteraceae bacterium]|nr:Ig-like domain-containing protein [Paludibacteraceae bacterium]